MAVCRSCAAELPEGARFCPACGAPIEARGGEERKFVTVLFADLVGSTALGDASDPEDVRAAIRPQLRQMRDQLELYGGTFEKFVGDAVMAVFGAPTAHEDDPERAVRAALAIRDAIPGVRCAVNTGEAVVTLGARAGAAEGIATGDVVNTAFRIEEGAAPDSVVVGETTYRSTQHAIEYGDRRLLQAKGKSEPIAVYEALRTRTELRPAYKGPPLAPLVGRKEELSLILDTLARARRDRTVQLVTIVGAPGIGKSRLVWELQRALEDETGLVTWRRGRCLPYGQGVTFWALGEILKAQTGILVSDDRQAVERKLARGVRDLVADAREADWVESHLRPLLGLGGGALLEARREEAFTAWQRFFEALAEWGPLVLVVEDLHWADEGLLDFVDHLADWSTGVPLVVLCTARPELHEQRPAWGARPNAATIALAPLSAEETGLLVSYLLKQSLVPAELQEAMQSAAEGNPLYTEEFLRLLVDRGFLFRDGSGWELRAGDVPIPESVQAIIAARLDALSPDEKEAVMDAAVLGRHFWPSAVAALSGRDSAEADTLVRALERKELVRRRGAAGPTGAVPYAFRHVLVRDVAYGQIPRSRRGGKHVLAARWIEELGRPDDYAELLAHHYVRALETLPHDRTLTQPAREALRRAGERALALNAFAAAARHLADAVTLVDADDPERADLILLHGSALFHAHESGAEELEEARDIFLARGDRERAAEAESMLIWLAWYAGRHDEALARVEAASALARELRHSPAKAEVLSSIASFLVVADRLEEAMAVCREALALTDEDEDAHVRARALTNLGVARTSLGDVDGLRDLEEAIAVAAEASSPEVVRSTFNLAAMHFGLGDLRRAFTMHADARAHAQRFGHKRWLRWLEAERVGECYWSGRWDEALERVDSFLGEGHYLDSYCLAARAKILLARDEEDDALAAALRALELAQVAGDAQLLHPALAVAAYVQAETDDRLSAIAALERLVALGGDSFLLTTATAWADAARAARLTGREELLIDALPNERVRTPWAEAAGAQLRGAHGEAASLYARIGALPEEAYACLCAYEDAGDTEAAARAALFFEEVAAGRYLGQLQSASTSTPRSGA
jgi:class 3 adenylate cyclase/tetratricopeptide (TPR) repeat protein